MEENAFFEQNTPPSTPAQTAGALHQKRARISLVSSLLVIALAVALIILGERILIDVNRLFNPAHNLYGYAPTSGIQEFIPTAHARIADPDQARSAQPQYNRQDYETYRLFLHAAVSIPLFLLMFLIYYYFRFKRTGSPYKILSYAYMLFAFYIILRLLIELSVFVIKNFKTGGVYIVLGMIIVMFTALIVIVQKRLHAKTDD